MRFSRKIRKINLPFIKINDRRIQKLSEYKFLGIIFDERLTWKQHIQYVSNNCLACSNIIKYIAKKWWGAHQQTLIILYNNLIMQE